MKTFKLLSIPNANWIFLGRVPFCKTCFQCLSSQIDFTLKYPPNSVVFSYKEISLIRCSSRKHCNTVDPAKNGPFCPVLTLTGGVTVVFLQAILNRKYVYPIENWIISMFYLCQFCTWALCFRVISLWSLETLFMRGSFYAGSTVICFDNFAYKDPLASWSL